MHDILDEAREDSLFPEEITKNFYYNNEVYISYLVERDNIPHVDLTMNWNFIIDDVQTYPTSAGELMHYVRKEFENRGTRNFNIGDGKNGHVQARSILGPVYDHTKGNRKLKGRSPEARVW